MQMGMSKETVMESVILKNATTERIHENQIIDM